MVYHNKGIKGALLGSLFTATAAELLDAEICHRPLAVLFVQDETESFQDDFGNMVRQLGPILQGVYDDHPYSRFGLVAFKDKPVANFGWPTDECYRNVVSLNYDPNVVIRRGFQTLFSSGGKDMKEDTFGALFRAALDPFVGWDLPADAPHPEYGQAKVIILSTDYLSHESGDAPWLPSHDGTYERSRNAAQCSGQDYVKFTDMTDTLKEKDIYLVTLIPSNTAKVVNLWRWVNDTVLEQPSDFVQFLDADSGDVAEKLRTALNAVTVYDCIKNQTTTTELPTDTTTLATTDTSTPTTTTTLETLPSSSETLATEGEEETTLATTTTLTTYITHSEVSPTETYTTVSTFPLSSEGDEETTAPTQSTTYITIVDVSTETRTTMDTSPISSDTPEPESTTEEPVSSRDEDDSTLTTYITHSEVSPTGQEISPTASIETTPEGCPPTPECPCHGCGGCCGGGLNLNFNGQRAHVIKIIVDAEEDLRALYDPNSKVKVLPADKPVVYDVSERMDPIVIGRN